MGRLRIIVIPAALMLAAAVSVLPVQVANALPPSTTVIIPSDNATVSGTSQILDVLAPSGVTQVQYELTGGTLTDSVIATATPTIFGWLARWNTTTVANGTYTLQSVASSGGLTGTSPGITVMVDNAAPTTTVGLPSNGATASGSQYLDASSSPGVTQVQYELTGGTLTDSVIATATPTIFGWLARWDTTTVANGTYMLQSVASYSGGISGASLAITVNVNNPAPITTIVSPAQYGTVGNGNPIDVTASPGVTQVQVTIYAGPGTVPQLVNATPTIYGWVADFSSGPVPGLCEFGLPGSIQSEASYSGGVSGFSLSVNVTIDVWLSCYE